MFLMRPLFFALIFGFAAACVPLSMAQSPFLRAGIIGLDTEHVVAFTRSLNVGPANPADAARLEGVKVVAAYAQGSKDIEASVKRVPEYTEKLRAMQVEIVPTIEELVEKVDVLFLESNDGRVHLEQVRPIFKSRKPVFIDKPLAGSLVDCLKILEEAKSSGTPLFSSSSLRFGKSTALVRDGSLGLVNHAETFSPAHFEKTHPDLYWYGIHGVESLFTVMGTGAISVQRSVTEEGGIQVTGQWKENRTGIFREANATTRKGYGGIAKGDKGEAAVGSFDGYDVLLMEVVKFFNTKTSPVSLDETLEIYAFMEASDESKRRNGAVVTLKEVLEKARAEM